MERIDNGKIQNNNYKLPSILNDRAVHNFNKYNLFGGMKSNTTMHRFTLYEFNVCVMLHFNVSFNVREGKNNLKFHFFSSEI